MNVKICGIQELEVFKQCLACDGNLTNDPNDDNFLRCRKCQVQQAVANQWPRFWTIVTLTGYGDFLKKIAGYGEVKEVTGELLTI